MDKDYRGCIAVVRGLFSQRDISEHTSAIISPSLSKNTMLQYNTALKKWWNFCNINKIELYKPSTTAFIEFLSDQYNNGASYSTLNTLRSAINLIVITRMEERLINRFLKGVFRLRPVFPKYKATWDPYIVLQYLSKLFPLEMLSLENLSLKLATLMALCTGYRLQTLSKVKINNIVNLKTRVQILIFELLKTSSLSKQQPKVVLPYFSDRPEPPELCVASTLLFYIVKTEKIRDKTLHPFIRHKKPYRVASIQTISRWIKTILKRSGVDTKIFTAYSTRHASTSAALRAGTSIETIRATAGWSKESEIFFKYYNRPIVDQSEFANNILRH